MSGFDFIEASDLTSDQIALLDQNGATVSSLDR